MHQRSVEPLGYVMVAEIVLHGQGEEVFRRYVGFPALPNVHVAPRGTPEPSAAAVGFQVDVFGEFFYVFFAFGIGAAVAVDP